eukprot:6664219-Alexandrium_andersonii.AAC.1
MGRQCEVQSFREALAEDADWGLAASIRARAGLEPDQYRMRKAVGAGALWCDLFPNVLSTLRLRCAFDAGARRA